MDYVIADIIGADGKKRRTLFNLRYIVTARADPDNAECCFITLIEREAAVHLALSFEGLQRKIDAALLP